VAPMFSAVPNRGFEHDVISAPLFVEDSLPMYVQVQPLATLRQLDVSFPVPDYRAEYRTKPVSYLGNLVGHEGEGSLLSRLKKEGLAESLFAGSGLSWRGGALFSVGISLTARGAEQPDRVLQLFFAHVEMLRSQGPQEWLYEEQSRVAELGFRFREHGSPMGYVSALASGMQHFDAEDILRGPYTMDSYDADVLAELLDYIRPNNALVTLSNADVEVDRVSRYYEVDYSRKPLALSQLAIERDDAALAELRLPPPNEFIAEDIALVGLPADAPDAPQVTLETDRQKIWFKTDDEFRRPKGATYINFRSPQVNQSPEQSARAALYASLAMDKVNEFAYPAQIAGLSFEFYKHAQGLSLRVRGYNDEQALLLQKLLVELVEPDFDPARFENIRSDMIRGLENTVAKRPSSQSLDDLREALLPGTWGEQALIDALRATELDDIQEYVPDFWRGASAEALVYGNYEQETVQQLNKMLAVVLPAGPGPALPAVEVVRLAPGEAIQYAVDIEHDDAVLAWYLQGEGDSWRDKAATALTAQVMKSGFFQELRTEQQLGYIVAAFNWTQLEVPGLVMLIQSPVADADALATAMLTFLDGVQPDLDAEQFARHKAALVSDILRPDENLGERAEFYWQSIARKQYDFEGRRTLADAVEALTLEDWQAYFERVFLKRQHSLQVVSPGRWNKLPTDGGRLYDDAGAIKATHETYRLE
jgi:secreted Zn-dependent insulinase-like peptidase